ncbi:GIY-YIG nuclease family protein, partial [bacterium]|nr:GIY-YIG nuclease family protein [bacterium]
MGIVYVLSNPAFDSYVKVGRTIDLEQRLKQLDNTSVPLPFRCVFAIEVEDEVAVERLVHQAFADVRVRTTREFFEIDAQRVISALKLTNGKDVTPKEDIAEDEESIEALERTVAKRKSYSFSDAHV